MFRLICLFSLSLLFSVSPSFLRAQEWRNPFDYPILLSGNFGELRTNHFHAGIDFKTQGIVGKPIHAVADGYISRVSVSPGGYGNGLYLVHPDGTTTVYGHLLRFTDPVAASVKEKQYAQEKFSVDLSFASHQFPVKRGEVIAWSGNTGSSGGPHLHFEVRDAESGELLDPLLYYKHQIRDTRPPRIQGIMFYPVEGEGMVNEKNTKQEFKQLVSKDGVLTPAGKIAAWGKIGLGVKAYDYMDNTHHVYGVKEIVLKLDGDTIYHAAIDRYALGESRYLNSFVDYADWIDNRSFYMKSFVEPANKLRFIQSKNRGYIVLDEERTYRLEYILTDAFGNAASLFIPIEGKEQEIAAPRTQGRELFSWRSENKFGAKGIRLTLPKGNLYDSFYFNYKVKKGNTALSDIHILHDSPIALHQQGFLSLRLSTDTLTEKEKYGIVRHNKNGRRAWIGGRYRNGWIDATIRELGSYSLAQDTVPPTIHPVDPGSWKTKQRFVFRLSDNLSGIQSYRGEIDGAYVLFERDNRSVITYHFDRERLLPGEHTLRLTVQDSCGNKTSYTHSFSY